MTTLPMLSHGFGAVENKGENVACYHHILRFILPTPFEIGSIEHFPQTKT